MSGEGGIGRIRLVSFNVNGLRAALKRKFGSVAGLLEATDADILCIQETKLRRSELDEELALVEGWDSFFACDRSPASRGYSGVATFVRSSLALPHAAEEGFSGLCAPAGGGGAAGDSPHRVHPALAERFSVEELQALDGEGRVLITDHGSFVLFNLYGPAVTSEESAEERSAFKLRFYQALQCRWEDFLLKGRAVVAVGDFNITPAPIDRADAEPLPQFYRPGRPDRLWLRSLLARPPSLLGGSQPSAGTRTAPAAAFAATQAVQPAMGAAGGAAAGPGSGPAAGQGGALSERRDGGQAEGAAECTGSGAPPVASIVEGRFADAFRAFHPNRRNAFSCWHTATAARLNNFGSRIDLVLVAGIPFGDPSAVAAGATPAGAAGLSVLPSVPYQQQQQQQQQAEALPLQPGQPPQQQAPPPQGGQPWGGGRGGVGFQLWASGSDIDAHMEGSDHAPVWVELSYRGGPFPCAPAAPPGAARHAFCGKQLKLHGWLAASGGAGRGSNGGGGAAQQAPSQSQQCGGGGVSSSQQAHGSMAEEWRPSGSQGSSQAATSAFSAAPQQQQQQAVHRKSLLGGGSGGSVRGRSGQGAAGAKRGGGGGGSSSGGGLKQASLQGFFKPPAAAQHAQQPAETPGPGSQPCPGGQATPMADAAAAGAPDGDGAAAAWGEFSALLAEEAGPSAAGGGLPLGPSAAGGGALWDPSADSGSQGSQGGAAGTAAAAADAWRQIMKKMEPPKCRHGEPAALKVVNKSGPNKGRTFYTCARPAGPKPHGDCGFFQWVNKRPGDHPCTTAGGRDLAGGGGSGKRPK